MKTIRSQKPIGADLRKINIDFIAAISVVGHADRHLI